MEGIELVAASITEDTYIIACLVLAMQSMDQAVSRSRADLFLDACHSSIEGMLLKRLISTAGLLRNIAFEKIPKAERDEDWERVALRRVGLLKTADQEDGNLCFREACNKILHHERYAFPASIQNTGAEWLSKLSIRDCAQFSGTHQKERWDAIVDVHEFAEAAYFCTSYV